MTPEEQSAFLQKVEKWQGDLQNLEKAEEALKKHAKDVDEKCEKAIKMAKDEAGNIREDIKKEFKEATDQYIEASKKRQEHLDSLDTRFQKIEQGGGAKKEAPENITSIVHKFFDDEDNQKLIKSGGRNKFEWDYDADEKGGLFTKAVGDIGTGNFTGSNSTSPADFQDLGPGVIYDPPRPIRLRDLMPVLPTEKDSIKWLHEAATPGEGGAGMVAMGAAKPQFDRDWVRKNYPVEKIATWARFPEEYSDDIPWMRNYLGVRGQDLVRDVEDTQILTGDGSSPNLHGLTVDGAAYTDVLALASAQDWDVLAAAVTQIRNIHYNPTAILLNPSRILTMLMLKDSTNRYLLPGIFSGQPPSVLGVPIIINTAINSNHFIVGDFVRGCQLNQRKGITVRFYEQDEDNVQKNLITVVIEQRLAFVTERPNAFARSTDFDAAITSAQS
jgi:HK97 family phage major capsid protein